MLWSISLPFAALFSLLVALHWRSESFIVAVDEAEYSLSQRVQRVAEMADLKFDTIKKLTVLLATDSRIISALKGKGDFAECTRYLQSVGDTLRLHRAFLLDKNGVCVASNDAGMPKNLLGVNLADRDYFIRAMLDHNLMAIATSRVEDVLEAANAAPPALLVVDSVQTLTSLEADGLPGNVSQVRAVATTLLEACRRLS